MPRPPLPLPTLTRPQSSQSLHTDRQIDPPGPLLQPIPEKNDEVEELEQPPFTNPDFSNEDAQNNKNHSAAAVESLIPDPKPSTQSSENVFSEVAERPQTSSVRSLSRTPHISQPQNWKHMVPFTPKQISSSVSESESLRNFCFFIVASMVVLSYAGFPILHCSLINKKAQKGVLEYQMRRQQKGRVWLNNWEMS